MLLHVTLCVVGAFFQALLLFLPHIVCGAPPLVPTLVLAMLSNICMYTEGATAEVVFSCSFHFLTHVDTHVQTQVWQQQSFSAAGQTNSYYVQAVGGAELTIALSWLDLNGEPGVFPVLTNDLDLKVRNWI